jgi:hypothetical protein
MTLWSDDGLRRGGDERRSAACLKACEGIPTELLEGGIILKLVAACVHVSDRRVREVLEELAMHRLRHLDGENAPRVPKKLLSRASSGR